MQPSTTLESARIGLLVGLMLALAANIAVAQSHYSTSTGLWIGPRLVQASLDEKWSADGPIQSTGAGLQLGAGFSESLGMIAAFDFASAVQFDLGVQYTLLNESSKWRPYGLATVGIVKANWDTFVPVDATGTTAGVGAGVRFHYRKPYAVDLNVRATAGRYNRFTGGLTTDEVETGVLSFRIGLGLALFPGQ